MESPETVEVRMVEVAAPRRMVLVEVLVSVEVVLLLVAVFLLVPAVFLLR